MILCKLFYLLLELKFEDLAQKDNNFWKYFLWKY